MVLISFLHQSAYSEVIKEVAQFSLDFSQMYSLPSVHLQQYASLSTWELYFGVWSDTFETSPYDSGLCLSQRWVLRRVMFFLSSVLRW